MKEKKIVKFIKDIFGNSKFIPLHEPIFSGKEKEYVADTIESTYVSSIGKYVDLFEKKLELFTKSPKAISVVNGTAGLQVALYMAGIKNDDYVITQALTFVGTCNAIFHLGANPIFVDVSSISMGLCPNALNRFLDENAIISEEGCILKKNKKRIKAILPMHTFGHPVEIDELLKICKKWNLCLIEDAAESFGSLYKGKHTGTFGEFGVLSFNGNKTITTGGGGAVLCKSLDKGKDIKHLTTTAKINHDFEFYHDKPGFNYRLPNLNAALGCAQMEEANKKILIKREIAESYKSFFSGSEIHFFEEPSYAKSNYWLNAIICPNREYRDSFLKISNSSGVATRPIWQLMTDLPMYKNCISDNLYNSKLFADTVVNLPSSPNLKK